LALKSKHQKQIAQPDQFVTTSMQAVNWLEHNRMLVFGGIAAVLLVGVSYVAWGDFSAGGRASVTRKVASVLEAEDAEVVAELPPVPEGQDEEDRPLTFRTEKQRSQTLVRRYKRLLDAGGSAELTAFAHLGLAGVYADQGKDADAQKEYQTVLDAGVDSLIPYAIEGMVYALETRGKRHEARAKLDELKTIQNGRFRSLASYHIARLEIADGDKARALDLLRRVQRDLAETPELTFLREQTMALITQLESEGVMATATEHDESDSPAKKKRGAKGKAPARHGGEGEDEENE